MTDGETPSGDWKVPVPAPRVTCFARRADSPSHAARRMGMRRMEGPLGEYRGATPGFRAATPEGAAR